MVTMTAKEQKTTMVMKTMMKILYAKASSLKVKTHRTTTMMKLSLSLLLTFSRVKKRKDLKH